MSKSIKDRMKAGDTHVIVDRSSMTAAAFDHAGKHLWTIPALARGQHRDWKAANGDTPPGLYKCGVVYETKGEAPYGPFCIDLIDLDNQETGNGRGGISWHGGGSGCPDPFAAYQELLPTHGCVRSHNAHIQGVVAPLVKAGQNHGHTVYVTVQE